MHPITSIGPQSGMASQGIAPSGEAQIKITSQPGGAPDADAAQFRAALERHTHGGAGTSAVHGATGANGTGSLSEKLAARTTGLASEVQKDQQYVSKLLEQATRTGDSMHLMKAMMAMSDYQIRVQTISKTVSKATSAIEQLTKLQ